MAGTEETVLILAPLGQDAPAMAALLGAKGIATGICSLPFDCMEQIKAGAGALLLTEEALELPGAPQLLDSLTAQPPWSELPLLILSRGGENRVTTLLDLAASAAGSVTLLERPMRASTLLRSVEVALRSRRRQYQTRGLLVEQARQQQVLRENQEQLRQALVAGKIVTYTWDVVSDLVQRSANAPDIMGAGTQTDSGSGFLRRIHPDDRPTILSIVQSLTPARPGFCATYRYARPQDDQELVLEDTGSAEFDPNGTLLRVQGVARDVTERKQAEDALRESENRFRMMANGTPVIIWVTDTQGHIRFVNRAYCEFFGVTVDEVQAGGWQPLVHPEDAVGYLGAFAAALDRKEPFRAQARVRRHDGLWRWIDSYGEPLVSESGQFLGMAGSSPDITERKEFQAELERLVGERTAKLQELVSELEHFSYTITHDMRAPLRAMMGFAEMFLEACSDCQPQDARRFLQRVHTSAMRMDLLITDALSYSEAIRKHLPLSPVDSSRLLQGMLQTYPEFNSHRAQIQVQPDIPLVFANEAGLTQVFSNLLNNSIKFAKPGEPPEVRIWAEVNHREPETLPHPLAAPNPVHSTGFAPIPSQPDADQILSSNWVRIWVEDCGIGIPEDVRPRIFNMFARGSVERAGTGIGLALVRKVVDRMGGRVGVEPGASGGSRFWLELSLAGPAA